MAVELHQFPFSHYNEKARWALAWKGIGYARVDYLPGPHGAAIRRLSGQQQTPVLVWHGEVVAGSGAIVDFLEQRIPEPPLLVDDAQLREQVAEVRRHFDEVVGPAVRTVVFSVLVKEGGYLCRMFSGGKPLAKRLAYRAMFPVARGMIAKANGTTDPANVIRSFGIVEQAFERVFEQTAASGYLVGTTFTAADLTAAALLAPLVDLSHPDMARPRPRPERLDAVTSRWGDHGGVRWVQEQYARHRR